MTTILNYQQWQEYALDTMSRSEIIKCPRCNGDGNYEEECECCENYSDRDCDYCDRSGNVTFSEIESDRELKSLYFSTERYKENLIKDLTDLARWTGEDRISVLVNHGLKVFSRVANKREMVTLQ